MMADCEHSQHWSEPECPGLTPEEVEFGEKVRSVSLNFVQSGGRADFHGDYGTVKERRDEMFANAKKMGNEPPEPQHRKVLV